MIGLVAVSLMLLVGVQANLGASSGRSSDPCRPSPCGPNTSCQVTHSGIAQCRCLDNFVPDGNTINGCKPQCTHDDECPDDYRCQAAKCVHVCQPGACGINADCDSRNHRAICTCPRGYQGQPESRSLRCVNPCIGACGEGALCDVVQGRASCSCPQYYQGSPQSRCYPECTAHDDCPSYQACYQLQCVDPCEGACGVGAECKVENHKPICFCPKGYTGHPFELCRPFSKEDLCRDNPCGHGADCTPGFDRQGNDRPVCTCPRGFIGNPIVSCQRGECERHEDCRNHLACYAYSCQNPCYHDSGSVCGDNAECTVKNHQPVCSCPPGYDGNPLQLCSPRSTVG